MTGMDVGYYRTEELRAMGFGAVGENVAIARNCHVVNPQRIFLGSDIKIHPFCSVVAYTDSSITIGTSVHIGGYSLFFALKPIRIGAFSSISTHVRMFTATDDFSGESLLGSDIPADLRVEKVGEIVLEDHCGMGSGAMLLPGTRMAEGCVLGGQSMLKAGETKPWTIYAGSPAVAVKARSRRSLELLARHPRTIQR